MPPFPTSPDRRFHLNSPFTKEQSIWVILQSGKVNSLSAVRRAFRQKFFPKNPGKVPKLAAFHRLIERFKNDGSVRPIVPRGRLPPTAEEVKKVKDFFMERPLAHVRLAAELLQMSFGKVWMILRKQLKMRPYRPRLVTVLTPANKQARMDACDFWLTHDEGWFDRVIWSDEKWFLLKPAPNCKNTVCWAPQNPNKLVPCKKAHGQKVMAWVGLVDGKCLPVHWFHGSVNGEAYLEMLKTVMWPAVKARATRQQLWFQQDGATPHVTPPVMKFLHSKFGNRIISRNSEHRWPPNSPDLSCLDFSFWSVVTTHIIQCEPKTLQELKELVEEFARNMDEDMVRRMARHTRRRAELCRSERGGHFEHLL